METGRVFGPLVDPFYLFCRALNNEALLIDFFDICTSACASPKGKEGLILGANFSSKNRNISEWKGELFSQFGEKIKGIVPGH